MGFSSPTRSWHRRNVLLVALAWSIIIVGLSVRYATDQSNECLEMARTYARAAHEKDMIYRRWNAFHGGVYAPATKVNPPNPHLDVPERDVTTPSGRVLTLVNPAYMTRQVHELGANQSGISAHITSLKPLNPVNMPDNWERRALAAMEQGETEVSDLKEIGGEPYMRLIRPLYIEQGCLKCHEAQGYELGDVRGGISVSVPVGTIWAAQSQQSRNVLLGYGTLWLFGIVAIASGGRELGHRISQREEATRKLEATTRDLERANKSLQEKSDAARAATEAKSEFLANVSHEIRTPMTAILGFSEVLMGSEMDQEQLDAATAINQNGEYLIEIINDILDLSKIEAGRLEVEQIRCSPPKILSDVTSLMRVRANAKGLRLQVEYDGPIPETIQSDPTRLRQILINLAGNAVKFTEVGTIRLVARLLGAESEMPTMQFEVIDSGIGITEEQLAGLFKPFHQADASTTRRFGGTGLGLAISKRLACLLGGDITVKSVVGEGSTFTVTVATGTLDGVTLRDNAIEGQVSTASQTEATALTGQLNCRVLLAEDGPDNQRLVSFLLKKAGAVVTVAENGQIAHDLALAAQDEGNPFDLILMDMQMPVMDGYDATSKLREAGYSAPIVALTAHAMSTDRDKCLKAGCDDFLTKPIDRKDLISKVARYTSDLDVCTPSELGG